MNIKISLLVCFVLFISVQAETSQLITITSPAGTVVTDKDQLLEGKVDQPFVKSLKLTIEPFIIKDQGKIAYESNLAVNEGYFTGKILLFPGLNLIRVASLSGKESEVKPVFLLSAGKKLFGGTKDWGANSPIFFTNPAGTKVDDSLVVFRGIVTEPKIEALDIVVMDTLDFLSEKVVKRKTGNIEYQRVVLNKQRFNFSASLKEGLNIILAKAYRQPVTTDLLQIKSVIYEKASSALTIYEPELKENKLLVAGKINGQACRQVRVKIEALVEKETEPGEISSEIIFDRVATVKPDGSFNLKIPWEADKGSYTIKSFPTIYVYAGNEVATKTLTKWW